jgi:hypothetical protein
MIPMNPQQMERSAYDRMGQMLDGKTPQAEVNYRQSEDPARSCGTCTRFQPPADCALVAGKVSDVGLCDAWSADEESTVEPEEM